MQIVLAIETIIFDLTMVKDYIYNSIYVTNAPPLANCTHPIKNQGCVFFFLHECFGMVIPFSYEKYERLTNL